MSIDDFIISVFCLIDDELKKILSGKKLRQRGPQPELRDSRPLSNLWFVDFRGYFGQISFA